MRAIGPNAPKYTALVGTPYITLPLSLFHTTEIGPKPVALAFFTDRSKIERYISKELKVSKGRIVEFGKDISFTNYMPFVTQMLEKVWPQFAGKNLLEGEALVMSMLWPIGIDPTTTILSESADEIKQWPTIHEVFSDDLGNIQKDFTQLDAKYYKGFTIFTCQHDEDKDFGCVVYEGKYKDSADCKRHANKNRKEFLTQIFKTQAEAEAVAYNWIDANT